MLFSLAWPDRFFRNHKEKRKNGPAKRDYILYTYEQNYFHTYINLKLRLDYLDCNIGP